MLISARRVHHTYRKGAEPVLDGVDLTFAEGSVTALTGPSGCGKSTLLYILALLLTPSAGDVSWGTTSTARLGDGERARLRSRHGGFVFQDALLDPALTALDNVLEATWLARIPRATATGLARELLERLGVGDRASHRPGEISGGQAQRIGLARALVTGPDVIFADEPSGNLDGGTADVVWNVLTDAAAARATVIVATHDTVRASRTDRMIRLGAP